jgi:hypothetical protein
VDNRVSCVDGQARDGFVGAARWSVLPADGGQGEETEQRRTCKYELEYPRLSVSSVHKRLVKIFLERRPVWGLVSSGWGVATFLATELRVCSYLPYRYGIC